MQNKARKIIINFTDILKSPEMQILPGQIAFYLVMAIIPIATISAVLASCIANGFSFMDSMNNVLPTTLANILGYLSKDMRIQGIAFVLIFYLIVGSNAPGSIIIASNIFYGIEQPNYIRLKLKSFVMTILIVILLLFVVLIPLFGDTIVHFLTTRIIKSSFLVKYKLLYVIGKALISFTFMYLIIKFLYTYAPSKKIDRSTTVKGSIFTSFGWILATYVFSFYITRIASYDLIYGNFANILVLLLWVYILAYLFVVGMALNVDEYHKQRIGVNEDKEKEKNKNKRKKENNSK